MAAQLKLDDVESLKEKLDERADNLFKARPGVPQLQVTRYGRPSSEDEEKRENFQRNREVKDISAIRNLRSDSGCISEAFFVRQDRSWTTLNISRSLFQDFMNEYHIFPQFWKYMFTFGRKDHENEFEFPQFRARRTVLETDYELYEFAYMLRRVELHGRELAEGQSPWSIRQTGVYHSFKSKLSDNANSSLGKSVFLMVAPSPTVEEQLEEYFESRTTVSQPVSAWNTHRLLVADSLKNWMDYMAHLEEKSKEQSDPILLAKVGTVKENLAPLTDFNINFADRQELKNLEDEVLDLQVILSTMQKTIARIQNHCKKSCLSLKKTKSEEMQLEMIIDEFDEYIVEAEALLDRSKVLQRKSQSTSQLSSDLLSYEEAVALKDLTRETQLESKSMHHLTERSTKDAAAVKILTVITLVYLPTTIVSNFFSTQFVETNDSGIMRLSNNAWLLAAISIPLTIITIALWGTWVYFTKVTPPATMEHPSTIPAILRRRQSSFKSILSSRKFARKSRQSSPTTPNSRVFRSISSLRRGPALKDVEIGIMDPEKSMPQSTPPPLSIRKAEESWSSTATTANLVKFT